MADHRGQCFCGNVRYRIAGPLTGVIACHCKDCQRLHGNFNVLVVADKDDVTIEGEPHLRWFASSTESKRAFCTNCGGRLFKDKGTASLLITAGTLDGPTGLSITRNIWTESKGDWYALPATP
jgi:hypothetical protein